MWRRGHNRPCEDGNGGTVLLKSVDRRRERGGIGKIWLAWTGVVVLVVAGYLMGVSVGIRRVELDIVKRDGGRPLAQEDKSREIMGRIDGVRGKGMGEYAITHMDIEQIKNREKEEQREESPRIERIEIESNAAKTESTMHQLDGNKRQGADVELKNESNMHNKDENKRDDAQVEIENESHQIATSSQGKYYCGFRNYEEPKHMTGLPFLADVFAADEGQSIYFLGVNKGGCLKEWKQAQEFHSTKRKKHYFNCIFPDGSEVRSDPVHRKNGMDSEWSNAVYVIRCPVPPHLQRPLKTPSTHTNFTVSLKALRVIEKRRPNREGVAIRIKPIPGIFRDIPVCHGEWPSYNRTIVPGPSKKYFVSLVTRMTSSYRPNAMHKMKDVKSQQMVLEAQNVVSWVEYHLAIGFDHFYIYDNDENQKNALFDILRAYIDNGIVTYIWFPYEDCIRDHTVSTKEDFTDKGAQLRIGQYVAGNAALRRYAHQTEYMAHWDVDEYLVLPKKSPTVREFILHEGDTQTDVFRFEEVWFTACNQSIIRKGMLPMERASCTDKGVTPPKMIMKVDRTLFFLVHNVIATVNNRIAKVLNFHNERGFIAHFRNRPTFEHDLPEFEGVVSSSFNKIDTQLQHWADTLRKRVVDYLHKVNMNSVSDSIG